jgi:hypothetical protein
MAMIMTTIIITTQFGTQHSSTLEEVTRIERFSGSSIFIPQCWDAESCTAACVPTTIRCIRIGAPRQKLTPRCVETCWRGYTVVAGVRGPVDG